jgi:predicted ATPase
MLTSFHLQNFKAWHDTGRIQLKPLTFLFGVNSAGKSSLGHWLLALKQTVQSVDRRRALHLGDDHSLVDLGTFTECLHNHDLKRPLEFSLRWCLPDPMTVVDPLSHDSFTGKELGLDVSLVANPNHQPTVHALRYRLFDRLDERLNVLLQYRGDGELTLESTGYELVQAIGNPRPLEPPEKFYRISESSLTRYQNGAFLSDLALSFEQTMGRLHYLGPLRDAPRRVYQWAGDSPEDVGQKGEYVIAALLAAQEEGRVINFSHREENKPFDETIAGVLQRLGVIDSFAVKPVAVGRREYEVLLQTLGGGSEVKLTDVGFGVSQILPAVVEAFYCPPHSTIWMEQPEIHLHPQVQANLADVFIDAIHASENGKNRQVQLIIESHSEHLLNRLQRRIAERLLSPDDVAIYFCAPGRNGAHMERLKLDESGEIENWPEDFFGDEMADIAGRALAAMKHKGVTDRG